MQNYLTIKDFSRLTHTPVDTLKHYDRIGLFRPARIGDNNYRYYLPEQSILLSRILFGSKAGIPLKEIEKYIASKDTEITMTAYNHILDQISKSRTDWAAIENAIINLRYYYGLSKQYKEGELFEIYLPEWFIIKSAPQDISSPGKLSNSEDVANQLFFSEYRQEGWPHYLLGALYPPSAWQKGHFSAPSYYLKIDHPERYRKDQIHFIEPGYWAAILLWTKGKGLSQSVRKFLEILDRKQIRIKGNILAMDVVNNLITSRTEEYCTMIYALKGDPHDLSR